MYEKLCEAECFEKFQKIHIFFFLFRILVWQVFTLRKFDLETPGFVKLSVWHWIKAAHNTVVNLTNSNMSDFSYIYIYINVQILEKKLSLSLSSTHSSVHFLKVKSGAERMKCFFCQSWTAWGSHGRSIRLVNNLNPFTPVPSRYLAPCYCVGA